MADFLQLDGINDTLELAQPLAIDQFDDYVITLDFAAQTLQGSGRAPILGDDSTSLRRIELTGPTIDNITSITIGSEVIPLDTAIDISARSEVAISYNETTNILSATQRTNLTAETPTLTTILAGATTEAAINGVGVDTLLRYGGGADRVFQCRLYRLRIELNGALLRDWNAASANGTGLVLPDDASNFNATLVNFTNDDGHWLSDSATSTLTLDMTATLGGDEIPAGDYDVDFYNATSKAYISTANVTFASGTATSDLAVPATTSIRFIIETGTHLTGNVGVTV